MSEQITSIAEIWAIANSDTTYFERRVRIRRPIRRRPLSQKTVQHLRTLRLRQGDVLEAVSRRGTTSTTTHPDTTSISTCPSVQTRSTTDSAPLMDDAYLDGASSKTPWLPSVPTPSVWHRAPGDPDHESSYPNCKRDPRVPTTRDSSDTHTKKDEGALDLRPKAGIRRKSGRHSWNQTSKPSTSNQEPDQPGYSTFSPGPTGTPSSTRGSRPSLVPRSNSHQPSGPWTPISPVA